MSPSVVELCGSTVSCSVHSCPTEQCFGSSKGLRILGALYQLDRGKPIPHNVTALKKNCGDLLHFPQRSAEKLLAKTGREH